MYLNYWPLWSHLQNYFVIMIRPNKRSNLKCVLKQIVCPVIADLFFKITCVIMKGPIKRSKVDKNINSLSVNQLNAQIKITELWKAPKSWLKYTTIETEREREHIII